MSFWKAPVLLLFFLPAILLAQQNDRQYLWQFIPSGAIKVPPVVLDNSVVAFISEDHKITILDGFGGLINRWELEDRLAPFLLAGTQGNLRLVTTDRRIHEVDVSGDVVWSFELDGLPAGPGVVDWYGRTYVLSNRGTLYKFGNNGQLIWSRKVPGSGPSGLILDIGGNLYVDAGDSGLWTYDLDGRLLWERQWNAPIAIMALHPGGNLWIQDENGLLRIIHPFGEVIGSDNLPSFHSLYFSQNGYFYAVTNNQKLIQGNSNALGRYQYNLPGIPSGQGALSREGNLYLPIDGSIYRVDIVGRPSLIGEMRGAVTSLTMTDQGVILAGDEQWTMRAFEGEPIHEFSWSQAQGNSGHNPLGNREGEWESLLRPWMEDNDFIYFRSILASGRREDRLRILIEMEQLSESGELWETWPFASIIILEISREGLSSPSFLGGQIVNDWPSLRRRAYDLLGSLKDPRIRKVLLDVLEKEYDSNGIISAVTSLGEIGYDFDGLSLLGFHRILTKFPNDLALAQAVWNAALRIRAYNLELTNLDAFSQIMVFLMMGNYPGEFRRQVILDARQNF